MEERTRAYLRGRFGDHYRRTDVARPPDAGMREWGYIPWTRGPGTTMIRHNALLDLVGGGSLTSFLARERPRHIYYSTGRYERPGTDTMDEKGWIGSDLVFDLDADHLPAATTEDTYAERLGKCKAALTRLLALLEEDFGFEDMTIVFSGGRGYHVHVRDQDVFELGRAERREVVNYLRGKGLAGIDRLTSEEPVFATAYGRETDASNRVLQTAGGWGRRVHRRVQRFAEEIRSMEEDDAIERLRTFEGIGEKKARTVLGGLTDASDAVAAGHVDVRPGMMTLFDGFVQETIYEESAAIDEPVTTDINRLIRLPGSLHGGTGLAVQPIARAEVSGFDPLVDAIPDTFRGHDIAIQLPEETRIDVGGDSFTVPAGEHSVPEYAGIFLMARGQAEKGMES